MQPPKTQKKKRKKRVNGSTMLKIGSTSLQMKKVKCNVDFFGSGVEFRRNQRILLLISLKCSKAFWAKILGDWHRACSRSFQASNIICLRKTLLGPWLFRRWRYLGHYVCKFLGSFFSQSGIAFLNNLENCSTHEMSDKCTWSHQYSTK